VTFGFPTPSSTVCTSRSPAAPSRSSSAGSKAPGALECVFEAACVS
jgi:hypothetical protein